MPFIECNNATLFYTESGNGDECIVFSHGLLFDHLQWEKQVHHFEKKYRCITYDHRGQGKSQLIGSLDMDTLYEDGASLIRQLNNGTPVHFIGLSMGGFVGMRLAARKPSLLKTLTLLETSADAERGKIKYKALGWIFRYIGARSVSKKVIKILFGKSFVSDPANTELLNYWKGRIESYPSTITRALDGVITRKSVHEEIAGIRLPTLVIVGDEDVATKPKQARRIHQQIRTSTLSILPRAGHSACLEQPEMVNAAIEKFILEARTK